MSHYLISPLQKVASLRRMLGYEDKNKKYEDEKEKDESESLQGSREDSVSNHSVDSLENPVVTKHSIPNSVDNKTVDELERVVNNSPSGTKKDIAGTTAVSPRKIPNIKREDSGEIISASLTADAVVSVAADWQSFRNIRQCVCSTPFDHFARKVSSNECVLRCYFIQECLHVKCS